MLIATVFFLFQLIALATFLLSRGRCSNAKKNCSLCAEPRSSPLKDCGRQSAILELILSKRKMSRFAIKYPYLIIVFCLVTCVVGITSLMRLPVDLFPTIKIPVVVVATFYSGMPPEQIENDITGRFERFFT